MANVILIKRSKSAGVTPNLQDGELAINQADMKLYIKNSSGANKFIDFSSDAEKVASGPIATALNNKQGLNAEIAQDVRTTEKHPWSIYQALDRQVYQFGTATTAGVYDTKDGYLWYYNNSDKSFNIGPSLNLSKDANIPVGKLSFGSQTRQMLNFYSTSFGLGVQTNTLYVRTGSEFAVHANGSHSDAQGDPGTGGTNLLRLRSDAFTYMGKTVYHAGNVTPADKGSLSAQSFAGPVVTPGFNVKSAGDAIVNLESLASDTNTYRIKQIFSTKNDANNGNDWLFRAVRPFDGANQDWILRSGTGGTILTSNSPGIAAVLSDITALRSDASGSKTGVIFLGNQGSNGGRYLYYDGNSYFMPGANLYVNGGSVYSTTNPPPTAGITGSPIAANLGSTSIPAAQTTILMSGFWAEGDGGSGAIYTRGTGFAQRNDAGGNTWHIANTNDLDMGWLGLLPDRSDVGAMNHNVYWINQAIDYMGGIRKGGRLRFPAGNFYINAQLNCPYGGVLCVGAGGLQYPHDNPNSTIIYPTTVLIAGAGMNTMVYDYTPGYAQRGVDKQNNWKNMGGGWVDMMLDGNNQANRCLTVLSRNTAKYHLFTQFATGDANIMFECQTDFRGGGDYQIGEPGDNQCLDLELHVRQTASAGPNTHCVYLRGAQYNGNTSIIDKAHITCYHHNGHGVLYENADNVVINALRTYKGGTGYSFYVCAAVDGAAYTYGNEIHRYSSNSPGRIEGTIDRPGTNTPGKMFIWTLDKGNGTPAPILNGNAQLWYRNGHEAEMYWNNGLGAWTLKQRPGNGDAFDGGMSFYSANQDRSFIFLPDGRLRLGTGTILG